MTLNKYKLLIYFLAIITVLIFYQLYKVLGRADFLPEQKDDGSFSFDEEEVWEEKAQRKEIQGQWATLKKIQSTLTPKVVVNELLDMFKKIHLAFAQGVVTDVADFLSATILDKFKADVARRKDYVMHMSFVQEPQCIIKQIAVDDDKNCTVDTEFHSEQIVYIEDKNGVIIDNPHKLSETIKNYWIFKKNLSNLSSPWLLVEMV